MPVPAVIHDLIRPVMNTASGMGIVVLFSEGIHLVERRGKS
jgi:hypothetical protein